MEGQAMVASDTAKLTSSCHMQEKLMQNYTLYFKERRRDLAENDDPKEMTSCLEKKVGRLEFPALLLSTVHMPSPEHPFWSVQ